MFIFWEMEWIRIVRKYRGQVQTKNNNSGDVAELEELSRPALHFPVYATPTSCLNPNTDTDGGCVVGHPLSMQMYNYVYSILMLIG